MENIVSLILEKIDGVILGTGQTLFNSTVIQITNVTYIMLSLLIILIGINTSLNVYKMSMRDSMQIILRILLVMIVGISWNNFEVIFNALTNATQGLALSFFAPFTGDAGGTASQALDKFGDQMAQTTDTVAEAVSSFFRALIAFFLNVMMAFLMAAYVIVVGASKIVIAFLIGFAPFAMICTIFDRTKTIFEGWLTTLVANLLYPVVAAGIVGTVVTVAKEIFKPDNPGATTLGSLMAFIVLMLAGAMAIMKIPSIAHGLTGSFGVASFGPKPLTAAGAAFGGAAGATYAGRKMSNKLDAMRDTMRSGARRADHADYDGLSRDDRKSLDRPEELRAKGQEMMRKNVMLAKMREEFREKGPK